jgi:hypothetical protein
MPPPPPRLSSLSAWPSILETFINIESASVLKSVAWLLSLTAPVGWASDSKSVLRIAVAIWTDQRQNHSVGIIRQTRRDQVQEAEKIYEWLIFQRELAGDLIRKSAKIVEDKEEATDTRLDLEMIADVLATASKPGSKNALWQEYKRHFVSDRNREKFFGELRSLTRLIGSRWLVRIGEPKGKPEGDPDEAFPWNESLLPRNIAPHVLRVAILHPGVLENFLPRFFVQASDLWAEKSTYRRALLILQAVPSLGWSAEKHTENLMFLEALDPSEAGSEVETVKKFIRDLRRRYQNYLDKKAQRPT